MLLLPFTLRTEKQKAWDSPSWGRDWFHSGPDKQQQWALTFKAPRQRLLYPQTPQVWEARPGSPWAQDSLPTPYSPRSCSGLVMLPLKWFLNVKAAQHPLGHWLKVQSPGLPLKIQIQAAWGQCQGPVHLAGISGDSAMASHQENFGKVLQSHEGAPGPIEVQPDCCAHFMEENTEAQSHNARKGPDWVTNQNLLEARAHTSTC